MTIDRQSRKSENLNTSTSLNDAISHFKTNLDQISCKNIFPSATPRTQSQSTSQLHDQNASQSISLNNFKLSTNKRMLLGTLPDIETNKIKMFAPTQPNFETIAIKPIPQTCFTAEKNILSISTQAKDIVKLANRTQSPTNSTASTMNSSISDTLKHLKHSTPDSFASQDVLIGTADMLEKVVKNFCDETDLTYFFSKFISSFTEKIKNIETEHANEIDSTCKTILDILNLLYKEDTLESAAVISEVLKSLLGDKPEELEIFVQPGFVNMRLFILTMAGYNLVDEIREKYSNYNNNVLFKSTLIEISVEALIISGSSFTYKSKNFKKDGFLNDFDGDFKKNFKKEDATLLINRNKWQRTKNFFLEAAKTDLSQSNSSLIGNHIERRALVARTFNCVDEEFDKLISYQADTSQDEEVDLISLEIALDFIIIGGIHVDKLIIPHSIIFV